MVSCDVCELWVHQECDATLPARITTLRSYMCPLCRMRRSGGPESEVGKAVAAAMSRRLDAQKQWRELRTPAMADFITSYHAAFMVYYPEMVAVRQ
jgi:hypothetical protein